MARATVQLSTIRSTWHWENVYLVTMGELVQLLKTEENLNKSKVQLKWFRRAYLVIIDDLMYMAMDQREANWSKANLTWG